jgi:transcriptional regulator with XRE-family HTH domain
MPEFTHIDLKIAREAQRMPRWKLAQELNVSESTIERWESGETMPHPDDIDRIGEALGDPSIWHQWMLSNYESYRRRYIKGCFDNGLSVLMARLRFETGDLLKLHDSAERDSLDGKIDDPQLKTQYIKELKDLIAAATDVLQELLRQ